MRDNSRNSYNGCGCTLVMLGGLLAFSGYNVGENLFNSGSGIIIVLFVIMGIIGIILNLTNKNK